MCDRQSVVQFPGEMPFTFRTGDLVTVLDVENADFLRREEYAAEGVAEYLFEFGVQVLEIGVRLEN
jgi:hypothetical protein